MMIGVLKNLCRNDTRAGTKAAAFSNRRTLGIADTEVMWASAMALLKSSPEGIMSFARALAAAFLAACILAAGAASAQTYPSRPVTLIVPYPPGGATDAIARIIQDSMSQSLGQQIVIENIGGAGGMIAAARAARAAPDGYTVLLHQVALAAGMTLYPESLVRRRKGFRHHRPRQHRRFDRGGAPDAAAEQYRRAGELDERARAEHQDRASRRRLVRSSGRRAGRPGDRRRRSRRFPIGAPARRSTICWRARST